MDTCSSLQYSKELKVSTIEDKCCNENDKKSGDLVSIITPSYNCARFIKETIESVKAQTYEFWEMIIVDDCSSDNSVEIITESSKGGGN